MDLKCPLSEVPLVDKGSTRMKQMNLLYIVPNVSLVRGFHCITSQCLDLIVASKFTTHCQFYFLPTWWHIGHTLSLLSALDVMMLIKSLWSRPVYLAIVLLIKKSICSPTLCTKHSSVSLDSINTKCSAPQTLSC